MSVEPAGQHTVRRLNAALVLGEIAATPGVSRAALAARTGLAKATVSTVVDRLVAARIVAEGEPMRRAGPGRRASGLALSPLGPHGLGVEIGVDYLACQLVDLAGAVRFQRITAGDNRNRKPSVVLTAVARLIKAATRAAADAGVRVGGIGVAVPGLVEQDTGLLRVAPNLGWQEVDIAREVAERTGLERVEVGNEADLAAVAEWRRTGLADFVRVSGEIGIGAGIVLDNALFRGVRGFAGELGHVSVVPVGGDRCRCGADGCLETVAGQEAILRAAGVASIEDLTTRLSTSDGPAVAAVAGAGRVLGTALAGLINVMDVPAVVLGGTYAVLEPWLREPVLAALGERVAEPVEVLRSAWDTDAAAHGAATAAVQAIMADPDAFAERVADQ
ncbi:ROK family transcriptional regulator [Labedaea rhizosphaerae]|uniref:Putative NBD/HSP70 family sugar kinase n=1 Tax=Labedaea rhizosphaerae TaxID=598644 RepID=A0A4R6RVN1_LABRH|nr:ROK family transcriptional regulator [Labedaea rhizosphaerae]TDP91069.1 putative NBD/HSP70 family sugar kinase [Labedaea rhizosphaerae]